MSPILFHLVQGLHTNLGKTALIYSVVTIYLGLRPRIKLVAFKKMYYPKLTYASSTIEGVFLFGVLCLSNKIYRLESLYCIGNFQIMHMEEINKNP